MSIDDDIGQRLAARFGDKYRDRRDFVRAYFGGSLPARRFGAQAVTIACVHHTAGNRAGSYDETLRYHRDSRVWNAPGYGLHIREDGRVSYGVGPSNITHGVYGRNATAFHVCLAGNFENVQPTAEQLQALYGALCILDDVYTPHGLPWRGPREIALKGRGTACPGTNLRSHVEVMRGVKYGAAGLIGKDRPSAYP